MDNIEEIVSSVVENMSCRASPEMMIKHDRLLTLLPEEIKSLTVSVNALNKKLAEIELLIERDKTRKEEINRLETSTIEIFSRLNTVEKEISNIYTSTKTMVWLFSVIIPVIVVLLDQLFYLIKKAL